MKRRRVDWGGDSKSSVTEGSTSNVTDFISQESVRKKEAILGIPSMRSFNRGNKRLREQLDRLKEWDSACTEPAPRPSSTRTWGWALAHKAGTMETQRVQKTGVLVSASGLVSGPASSFICITSREILKTGHDPTCHLSWTSKWGKSKYKKPRNREPICPPVSTSRGTFPDLEFFGRKISAWVCTAPFWSLSSQQGSALILEIAGALPSRDFSANPTCFHTMTHKWDNEGQEQVKIFTIINIGMKNLHLKLPAERLWPREDFALGLTLCIFRWQEYTYVFFLIIQKVDFWRPQKYNKHMFSVI